MAYTVTVDVVTEDIQNGHRFDSLFCPIARALARASECSVSVGPDAAWLNPDTDYSRSADLPMSAVEWIRRFDHGEVVLPISFELSFESAA